MVFRLDFLCLKKKKKVLGRALGRACIVTMFMKRLFV